MSDPRPKRGQIQRTATPLQRAPIDLEAGRLFINLLDRTLECGTPAGPILLSGIRPWNSFATYDPGDIVVKDGGIYSALVVVSPGAWDPAQWQSLIKDQFSSFVDEVGWDQTIAWNANETVNTVTFAKGALSVEYGFSYDSQERLDNVTVTVDDGSGATIVGTITYQYDANDNVEAGVWS